MKYFTFKKIVRTDPLIDEVYRLRYKVYCDEWGFEKPEDHPAGLEFDQFDAHSAHIGAFLKDTDQLIGTVRIILNSELGFPIEKHCAIDADMSGLDRYRIGEISRLAVSKGFRRRAVDRLIYDGGSMLNDSDIKRDIDERRQHEFLIVMGLYIGMYKESLELGLTNWYAVMAKGLYILLKRMDISFRPIGPEIDYHGLRAPYMGEIDEIYKRLFSAKAEYFEEYDKSIGNG